MYACTFVSDCISSQVASDGTYGILRFNERVVNSDNMNVIMLDSIPIDDTSNSAKAVDANVGRHSWSDEEAVAWMQEIQTYSQRTQAYGSVDGEDCRLVELLFLNWWG
jgi:hypothetical protein